MDLSTFLTCLAAVILLTLTPGVDTMLIIRNSARGGFRDGVVSSFGICSGLFVHATISALGISLILLQTAWAFTILKTAGACYLIWLGLSSWRRMLRPHHGFFLPAGTPPVKSYNGLRSFREGFFSNVLNPKTIVFYMAFLPQFIDPAKSSLSQALLVAALHFAIAMIWQCLIASMVDKARYWLQRPLVGSIFNGLTGLVLVYIGASLVHSR